MIWVFLFLSLSFYSTSFSKELSLKKIETIASTSAKEPESNILKNTDIKRSLGYMLYDTPETTPLAANTTYVSETLDISEFSLITTDFHAEPSTATGTLYLEFSPDGTNWDNSTTLFIIDPTLESPHSVIPITRFFRARYANGVIDQTALRLQVLFHRQASKGLTGRLEEGLTATTDIENVRSVIAGRNPAGNYENVLIGSDNSLSVNIKNSNTAFGEIAVAELTPILQLDFMYGIHPGVVTSKANKNGVITTENSMLKMSSGAAPYSSALAVSTGRISYNPGQGSSCRMSGIFSSGVTGSTQYIGAGTESNGFFFGYKDDVFGVMRRSGGSPEVRTLTVSTASSDEETIIITLDDVIKNNVSVTNSSDATITANEIAAADYTDVGKGWTAQARGDTVIFLSWDAVSTHTGTYSLTNASSCEGTFTQTVTGSSPSEAFTPQSSWNIDKFDGTGNSNVTLDPTKGNIYQIHWQWLGFGAIVYSIENPFTGVLEKAHIDRYSNAHTIPSIAIPQLPLFYSVSNTTNTSNLTIFSGSSAGFIDGKETYLGVRGGIKGNKTVNDTEIPVITLRNKLVHDGKINNTYTKINLGFYASSHLKTVSYNVYVGTTLVGANYTAANPFSAVEYDTSATSFTGGTYLGSVLLSPKSDTVITLNTDPSAAIINPGGHMTFTANSVENGTLGRVDTSINFIELR